MTVIAEDKLTHSHDLTSPNGFLRVLTCGSVDDGKSTLIGRLLYDTHSIPDDQLVALKRETNKRGKGRLCEELDFAFLVDGLEDERQQGITIDIAYRFFVTPKRKFVIADAPGHEEYTRNMATAASNADVAIVLLDARKGILRQTRRHCFIASLLGVRNVIVVVNKMDLVKYDQTRFEEICEGFHGFSPSLGFASIAFVPVSAKLGDNVAVSSDNMPWYKGKSLLTLIETVESEGKAIGSPLRLPVQLVSRPTPDLRGVAGQIASGTVEVGQEVVVAKSGRQTRVRAIICGRNYVTSAEAGQAVTVILEDDVEIARGNMLTSTANRPNYSDQFMAHVIWFHHEPMIPGRSYLCCTEVDTVAATVTTLKHAVDINTFSERAVTSLQMNEVGVCNISTQRALVFDAYSANRSTGNFILIDRFTNETVGAGMIDHSLRRAETIHWHALDVNKQARAALKLQRPAVLWFTGLSGSGKSTIANMVEKLLHQRGKHTYILDGDNVRHGLNRDLGFSQEARVENIRRAAEVAKLMADAGLIVIVSFISPFRSERLMARELFESGEFVEVFIDTPLDECARRDPKGLYKKAMAGEIANFTGISSPYETPDAAEIHLQTLGRDPFELATEVSRFLDMLELS